MAKAMGQRQEKGSAWKNRVSKGNSGNTRNMNFFIRECFRYDICSGNVVSNTRLSIHLKVAHDVSGNVLVGTQERHIGCILEYLIFSRSPKRRGKR